MKEENKTKNTPWRHFLKLSNTTFRQPKREKREQSGKQGRDCFEQMKKKNGSWLFSMIARADDVTVFVWEV